MLKWIGYGIVALLVVIQFIPVDRTNPPATQTLEMPAEVHQIMKRSCFDCHSNETVWPWYSNVAPVAWLVSYDVKEGREHLNFSEWDRFDNKKKDKRLEEIVEEVEGEKMPIPIYLITHRDAKVSAAELDVLREWVHLERMKLAGGEEAPVEDEEVWEE